MTYAGAAMRVLGELVDHPETPARLRADIGNFIYEQLRGKAGSKFDLDPEVAPQDALAVAIILDDGLTQDAPMVLEGVECTEQVDATLPWSDDELLRCTRPGLRPADDGGPQVAHGFAKGGALSVLPDSGDLWRRVATEEDHSMSTSGVSRRNLVRGAVALGGSGLVVAAAGGEVLAVRSTLAPKNTPIPYTNMFRRPPVLLPSSQGRDAMGPFARYRLTQRLGRANIVPGLLTTVAGYNGIFPGPTLRVPQGTRSELRVSNALSVSPVHKETFSTVTHLHGSPSLPQYDGYANDRVLPGFVKTYKYPNFQPGRTLWYHDHNHHTTAQNVFSGLAALYLQSDVFEAAQLPQGQYDVPLIVSDMSFNADGSVRFDDSAHEGFMGDIILVNGVPWPTMKVRPRVYRFRVLAAAISRSFRFALSTKDPMYIVGTDAGLTPVVQAVSSWRHGVAERYEVLIDFRNYRPGTMVELRNLSNKNNTDFANTGKVMRFEVVAESGPRDTYVIPTTLDPGPQPFANRGAIDPMKLKPEMATARRHMRMERKHGLWTINGDTWDDVERSGFQKVFANPKPYDIEIWELVNKSGGWFHPLHIHLVDCQIIGRNTTPDGKAHAWERGAKDTFYLGENESVTVLMQFITGDGNAGGRYMIHCHNLVHEDSDMMIQYAVGDKNVNDPINADPPVRETQAQTTPVYAADYPAGT